MVTTDTAETQREWMRQFRQELLTQGMKATDVDQIIARSPYKQLEGGMADPVKAAHNLIWQSHIISTRQLGLVGLALAVFIGIVLALDLMFDLFKGVWQAFGGYEPWVSWQRGFLVLMGLWIGYRGFRWLKEAARLEKQQ